MAPRTAFLPRGLSCHDGESARAHDNITQPAWVMVLLSPKGQVWDTEEPVLSRGGEWRSTKKKKAPLSENKLLRKEDLGLTLTEMGSLGNAMDRSGRKDLPGRGKAVVETRVCFLKLRG